MMLMAPQAARWQNRERNTRARPFRLPERARHPVPTQAESHMASVPGPDPATRTAADLAVRDQPSPLGGGSDADSGLGIDADSGLGTAGDILWRWLAHRLRLRGPVSASGVVATMVERALPPRWRGRSQLWLVPLGAVVISVPMVQDLLQAVVGAAFDALPVPAMLGGLLLAARALDVVANRRGRQSPASSATREPQRPPDPPPSPPSRSPLWRQSPSEWELISAGPGSPAAAGRRPARTRTPGPGTRARRHMSHDGSRPAGTHGPRPRTS